MTEYLCNYCQKPCRGLTHEEAVSDWWKCEACDVSYHVSHQDGLTRSNMFLRTEDTIYCLRLDWSKQRYTFEYRKKLPPFQPWQVICQFSVCPEFTPQQLREKLP